MRVIGRTPAATTLVPLWRSPFLPANLCLASCLIPLGASFAVILLHVFNLTALLASELTLKDATSTFGALRWAKGVVGMVDGAAASDRHEQK